MLVFLVFSASVPEFYETAPGVGCLDHCHCQSLFLYSQGWITPVGGGGGIWAKRLGYCCTKFSKKLNTTKF